MIITYEFNRDEVELCALSVQKFFKNTRTLVRRHIHVGNGYILSIATGNMADIGCEMLVFKSGTKPTGEDYDRFLRIHNLDVCNRIIKKMISRFPEDDEEIEDWYDYWDGRIAELGGYTIA